MQSAVDGKIAVIGGTGAIALINNNVRATIPMDTPYGKPSSDLMLATINHQDVFFLLRHGKSHAIPPHQVNYRANIHALKEQGVNNIIAINAVGGISEQMYPGRISLPKQLIDYTYGRQQTFYEDDPSKAMHINFTYPYSNILRNKLTTLDVIKELDIIVGGVYAVTQGPRLETAAEISKLERDGCHIVGMTGMPEASLARELDMHYACIAIVANWAAGKTDTTITMESIKQQLQLGMEKIHSVLDRFIAAI